MISVGICLVSLSFSVRFSKISGVFCFCLCIFPCSFLCYICPSVFPFWFCVFVTVFMFQLCLCGCMCLFCFFFACLCFFLSVNQPFSRCLCLNWSRQTQSSKVIVVRWSAILKFTQKTFQVWIYEVKIIFRDKCVYKCWFKMENHNNNSSNRETRFK